MLETKSGGLIWRAEFLTALKAAQGEAPLLKSGELLHKMSTDEEFETYFEPLMTAYSKWHIEYNIAQLL